MSRLRDRVDRFTVWAFSETPNPHRRRRWGVLLGIALALITFMWVIALFFAGTKNRNRIDDRRWASSAQAICKAAGAKIDGLAPASSARTPQDRAPVVDQANLIVDEMVRELTGLPITDSPSHLSFVHQWLSDYATYAGDRRAYADLLRAGRDTQLPVHQVNNQPIDERMNTFAQVNSMPDCKTHGDV